MNLGYSVPNLLDILSAMRGQGSAAPSSTWVDTGTLETAPDKVMTEAPLPDFEPQSQIRPRREGAYTPYYRVEYPNGSNVSGSIPQPIPLQETPPGRPGLSLLDSLTAGLRGKMGWNPAEGGLIKSTQQEQAPAQPAPAQPAPEAAQPESAMDKVLKHFGGNMDKYNQWYATLEGKKPTNWESALKMLVEQRKPAGPAPRFLNFEETLY